MTSKEFINEFDIAYNNIRSNQAPNIDNYELSVFLTKAQEQIVFNYINPKGNKYLEGFENSEKRRKDLKELVKQVSVKSTDASSIQLLNNDTAIFGLKSVGIKIPDDTMFIIYEEALIDNKQCSIIPITHDEILKQRVNPYRKPVVNNLYQRVWRLDSDLINEYNKNVELVLPLESDISEYKVRYIQTPEPIIVQDLNAGEFNGLGLSIKGKTEETLCKLNETIQGQILDRAVELALEAYQGSRVQSYPAIASSRNE